jgi:hypothetical protein
MSLIANTRNRVETQTSNSANDEIRKQTDARIRTLSVAGRAAIDRRLKELDEEWDVERTIELNASTLSVLGIALGTIHDRRWLILPAAVGAFLWQHAVQGWCPPIPILRRLGFRTQVEIEEERYALKLLRGDFDGVQPDGSRGGIEHVLDVVRS